MEKGKRKYLDRMCRINRIKKITAEFAESRRETQGKPPSIWSAAGKTPLFVQDLWISTDIAQNANE